MVVWYQRKAVRPWSAKQANRAAAWVNVRTVARYRANIENKLNLHSRADLVRYAVDKGLVSAAP